MASIYYKGHIGFNAWQALPRYKQPTVIFHSNHSVGVYSVYRRKKLCFRLLDLSNKISIVSGFVSGTSVSGKKYQWMTDYQRSEGGQYTFTRPIQPNSGQPYQKKHMQSKRIIDSIIKTLNVKIFVLVQQHFNFSRLTIFITNHHDNLLATISWPLLHIPPFSCHYFCLFEGILCKFYAGVFDLDFLMLN